MYLNLSTEFEVKITDLTYTYDRFIPAKITADPYYSSPAEGGESDITAVWIPLKDKNGNTVKVNVIDFIEEKDLEQLQEFIFEYEENSREEQKAD